MDSYVVVIWYMNEVLSYIRYNTELLGAIMLTRALRPRFYTSNSSGPLSSPILRTTTSVVMYVNGWESSIQEMSSPSS